MPEQLSELEQMSAAELARMLSDLDRRRASVAALRQVAKRREREEQRLKQGREIIARVKAERA